MVLINKTAYKNFVLSAYKITSHFVILTNDHWTIFVSIVSIFRTNERKRDIRFAFQNYF